MVLITLGLVFIVLYSYLAFNLPVAGAGTKLVLNSPDETSNLFFAKLFADQSTLKFKDEANQVAQGLVTPRSMRVINGFTVPASFLGLPIIYGTLAKLTGNCAIPFFTPIIGLIGLIFFYLLIKEIFNKNVAFISSVLALILPPFWYYATKGLMPNVAFVSFFIAALFFFIKAIKNGKWWNYVFAGIFTGLALMVRTSEIVWVGPLMLILAIINYKKIKIAFLLFCFFAFLLTFSPILYFNNEIYGSPFSLGYSLAVDLSNKNIIAQGLTLMEKIFLPFGFRPQFALKNVINYSIIIFPIWSLLIFISLSLVTCHLSLFHSLKRRINLLYLGLFILISVYLIIFYGSWFFYDNPDPEAVTIGTSYVRYWLPIYLFSLPFLGHILVNFFKRFKIALPVFAVYLWVVLAVTSYQLVMLDSQEGIFKVQKNLNEYQEIAAGVIKNTPANAIIIADRMDKIFFPERRVIFRLNVPLDYVRIKEAIISGYPVYYFYFTRTKDDLAYFSQQNFEPHGLKLGNSLIDFQKQSLYPVEAIGQ